MAISPRVSLRFYKWPGFLFHLWTLTEQWPNWDFGLNNIINQKWDTNLGPRIPDSRRLWLSDVSRGCTLRPGGRHLSRLRTWPKHCWPKTQSWEQATLGRSFHQSRLGRNRLDTVKLNIFIAFDRLHFWIARASLSPLDPNWAMT